MDTRAAARCAIALLFFSFASPAHADEIQRLWDELREAEEQVEVLKRAFPPVRSEEEERQMIAGVAKESELDVQIGKISAPERLLFSNGAASAMQLSHADLTARATYGDIERFLFRLSYVVAAVPVQSLRIEAADGNSVRFTARVALPRYAGFPDQATVRIADRAAELRHRIAKQREFATMLAPLGDNTKARRISGALAVLTTKLENQAVALTDVSYDGSLKLNGFTFGGAARAALRNALASAPLLDVKLEMPGSGPCRNFTVTGQLPSEGETDEIIVDNGMFDARAAENCQGGAETKGTSVVVRGTDADGITLKLANVDTPELFRALFEVAGASFILDPNLAGTHTLDVEKATIDEVVAALEKHGLRIGPPPLRHVGRSARTLPADDYSGEPVSISLREAALTDVLCLFGSITALEFHVPPDLRGTTTIFADTLPWDRILEAILSVAELDYRIDVPRMIVAKDAQNAKLPQLVDACKAPDFPESSRLLPIRLEQLESSDIALRGIARVKGKWQAWITGPKGSLISMTEGSALIDGNASKIDEGGVSVTTAAGVTRIPFQP